MRFAFIAKHRHIWPVSWLCDVLEVTRSCFHAWLIHPTSAHEIQDARLVTAIETRFKACDLHLIEKLMLINALRARPRRGEKPKDDGERSVIADNILDRDFQADRPNQKWLAVCRGRAGPVFPARRRLVYEG
jgi:putative transposase